MIWWLRVDKVESGVKRIKEVSGSILTLNKTNILIIDIVRIF
jgi:hypothetical protein